VINATGRDLAVVINQAVEKEKFSSHSAASAGGPSPVPQAAVVVEAPAAEQVALIAEGGVAEAMPVAEAEAVAGHSTVEGGVRPESGLVSEAAESTPAGPAEG
jgi:large subunit ribosomal protein L10